jgi:NADH:ubiquinone reductase (H+-translocating)
MLGLDELSIFIPESPKPRVVIIGGGFAGIRLAKGLKKNHFQTVMLDRHNYHTFQPLLYQVATAGLEPDSVAGPLRKTLEDQEDFYFRMAKVTRINPEEKTISTMVGDLSYDYLVLATGTLTNFFGNEGLRDLSFPIKQIPQALDLRSHMLQNFEKAVMTRKEKSEMESLMNFVIVGGGPTGVEVAGALSELRKNVLPDDYPELDFSDMHIYLVEGQNRLLGGMSSKSGDKAVKYLKKFGVEILLEKIVKTYDGKTVYCSDGTTIQSDTLIWAAGVKGNILEGLNDSSVEKGRFIVNEFNEITGYKDIFAIGDVAAMISERYPKGHPQLAPVAIQQGSRLAKNMVRRSEGKKMKPFSYMDKGSMATIGRNKAVVDLPTGQQFGGFVAWLIWMFIHLVSIIGFRNKLVVLSNWVWNYFTYDRGIRLIIRPFVKTQNKYQHY